MSFPTTHGAHPFSSQLRGSGGRRLHGQREFRGRGEHAQRHVLPDADLILDAEHAALLGRCAAKGVLEITGFSGWK